MTKEDKSKETQNRESKALKKAGTAEKQAKGSDKPLNMASRITGFLKKFIKPTEGGKQATGDGRQITEGGKQALGKQDKQPETAKETAIYETPKKPAQIKLPKTAEEAGQDTEEKSGGTTKPLKKEDMTALAGRSDKPQKEETTALAGRSDKPQKEDMTALAGRSDKPQEEPAKEIKKTPSEKRAASPLTEAVATTQAKPPAEKTAQARPPAEKPTEPSRPQVRLSGLFAFKMEMSRFYENDKAIPVTALRYVPWRVSQIKTLKKDGYSAVQLALKPQKNKRSSKPLMGHLKPAGFKGGAKCLKEIKQKTLPENIQAGHELSIESLKKGDFVRISALSKGRGFSGVIKRWGFHGGKASHGAKTHRKPGAIGQHTEPSRVFAGRKMPGHYGFKKVCLKKVPVVDVLPKEGLIFVKGPVPGARSSPVTLKKEEF